MAALVLALGFTAPAVAQVNLVQVAAGYSHTCVIFDTDQATGQVACWGWNARGQLGDGTTTDRLIPTRVPGLSGVTQIAVGYQNTCARLATGRVFCWGYAAQGDSVTPVRVPGITNATQVTAGDVHNCALLATGRVRCWGDNVDGQIGDGSGTGVRFPPVFVHGVNSAAEISAGRHHTCARLISGRARCWGNNDYGQLGDRTTVSRGTSAAVAALTGATGLSAGDMHNCAVLSDGRVRCWGSNTFGELGDHSLTDRPRPVWARRLADAVGISVSGAHSCALLSNGRVYCWGTNYFGEIGDGTIGNFRTTPVRVVGLTQVAEIASGGEHSCARRTDGRLFCWGWNAAGQLGDGTTTDHATPVEIIVDPAP